MTLLAQRRPTKRRPTGRRPDEAAARTVLSEADRRRPATRAAFVPTQVLLLIATFVAGAGPILWLAKAAISPTQEILREPLRPWPGQPSWDNIPQAWTSLDLGLALFNTVVLVAGSCLVQLVVATTLGYGFSVLRPRYGKFLYAAILATLFIPASVSLVAQYLTVLELPLLGVSLLNTPWAVWLPAGAHAFNVLLMRRFFDGIPRELFEAAEVDGGGPWTVFWRIVLPMSRPILAVVGLLALMSSWKDFLWPMLVLPDVTKQPIAAVLPRLAQVSEESLLMAGLFLATLPPVLIFLVFQRHIVRGAGFGGLKG
ncbi:carbohydrate ABC transporter permease [Polymorphospora rubra]|uniref:ABC transporter permease n=1 Tax=Polymorphospora rubra TaxID=338584 RepID=A0A810N993_9ACTN|nr:carbohydrate ABC transporter permease [Polymorphospora rubra]BCJ70202.1 ABC transporter permease [Polymorphospora rubra]